MLRQMQNAGISYNSYGGIIGGPSVEVQIAKWVLGGVEIRRDHMGRKRAGDVFLVVVPNRTRRVLREVISQYVRRGSYVVTDCWARYNNLQELGYVHATVNHSRWFKDPTTGACTNTIEGKWNGIKKQIPRQGFRSAVVLQSYLGEHMWRQQNKTTCWHSLMRMLRHDTNYRMAHGEKPPFMLEY